MFIAGPHQLYAAIIRPALTNKGCMFVCMYVCMYVGILHWTEDLI